MFGQSIKLFDLFGFEIRIDASWFLIAALIVWSLSSGYFPQTLPGLAQMTYVALALIAMLGLFGSLILHEVAHSLVARHYGLGIGGITLFLFGGVAELTEEPKNAASEFWIAMAGPAMSISLALVFWLGAVAIPGPAVFPVLLGYLAAVNLMLALFNMLPAFPLDGGRVLRAWLWQRSGDLLAATAKASGAGVILAFALMGLGVFSTMSGGGIGGLWLVLIGFFVLTASRGAYQQLLLKDGLRGRQVADLMTTNPHIARPDMCVADLVDQVMLAHAISFVPVIADCQLVGQIYTRLVQTIPRADWAKRDVASVMVPVDLDCVISPQMTAQDALARLVAGPARKLIVVDRGVVCGVLSLRDLLGHIAVVQALGGARHPDWAGKATAPPARKPMFRSQP